MSERDDLLSSLAQTRRFLRYTVRDLDDDQARQRTTVSALCLGAIIKHVTAVERSWSRFVQEGPSAMDFHSEEAQRNHAATFQMSSDEHLADLLVDYERAAAETDQIIGSQPDLDHSHPLPSAPWFEPGASWSVRRVCIHLIAETAQHAGHADIIRESLDGARTMG